MPEKQIARGTQLDQSGSPCRFGRKETEKQEHAKRGRGRVYPPGVLTGKASGTCCLCLCPRRLVAPATSPFQGRGTHWSSCIVLHRHSLSLAGNKGGAVIAANGEQGALQEPQLQLVRGALGQLQCRTWVGSALVLLLLLSKEVMF